MVTSNQMVQRCASVMLSLILLLGGICGGLCFAQATGDGAPHSCCQHSKGHCGHAGPSFDAHAAMAMVRIAPIVPTAPVLGHALAGGMAEVAGPPLFRDFSPPIRGAILRI